MPATARAALGMPDDDILAVEVGGVKVGATDKRIGLRQRHKPFLVPYGITDDV
jgi:hypothetical protein